MFDTISRNNYQKVMKEVLNPNGLLFILAFSYLEPLGIGPSQRLTKEDYINTFQSGWKIKQFENEVFETNLPPYQFKGLLTTIQSIN